MTEGQLQHILDGLDRDWPGAGGDKTVRELVALVRRLQRQAAAQELVIAGLQEKLGQAYARQ